LDKNYVTKNNERIFTKPGSKSENDFKIFTHFPKTPWPHSLEYIAACLQLKQEVEEINYSRTITEYVECPIYNGECPLLTLKARTSLQGRDFLFDFMRWSIYRPDLKPIKICERFGIKKGS